MMRLLLRTGGMLAVFPTGFNFGFSPGGFTTIDLIAAPTNAFNGALPVRRPNHWKHRTIIAILPMAVLGRIGGGVTRHSTCAEISAPGSTKQTRVEIGQRYS